MNHFEHGLADHEPQPLDRARQRLVDALDELGTAIVRLTAEMRRASRLIAGGSGGAGGPGIADVAGGKHSGRNGRGGPPAGP